MAVPNVFKTEESNCPLFPREWAAGRRAWTVQRGRAKGSSRTGEPVEAFITFRWAAGAQRGTGAALLRVLKKETWEEGQSRGAIPNDRIFLYKLLRSSPRISAVRLTLPPASSSFLRM